MKKLLILILIASGVVFTAHAEVGEVDLSGLDSGTGSCTGSNCTGLTQEQLDAANTAVTNATDNSTSQQSSGSGGDGKFVALAPIPGLTDIQPTQAGLAAFFNNLYKYLIGLAAVLAIIMIIWGGLEYSTQDSISKKSDGKERIQQAIFGLVLVLAPVLVFSIINPSILNLSINFTKLDTRSTSSTGTGTQTSSCPQYFMGTPPNCVALPVCTSTLTTMCTPRAVAAFDEGPYTARPTTNLPPGGIWCYQTEVTTRPEGYNFMCYRDQPGCQASCRASGTLANGDPYPRATDPSDPACVKACVNSF